MGVPNQNQVLLLEQGESMQGRQTYRAPAHKWIYLLLTASLIRTQGSPSPNIYCSVHACNSVSEPWTPSILPPYREGEGV